MKILKNGGLYQPIKFHCYSCGCIWEAEKDEVNITRSYFPVSYNYGCPCPECGTDISINSFSTFNEIAMDYKEEREQEYEREQEFRRRNF